MRPNVLDFWDKYELVSSTENYVTKQIKSKICRFCDKTDQETTFLQDTHMLPELIGNREILNFDECDQCNELFSDFESHLAIFTQPSRTLLGINGKNKIPIFQSRTVDRNEDTRTTFKHIAGNKKELYAKKSGDYTINTDAKTFETRFRKPPYIPVKVYKSLLKIGLSLLPKEFDKSNKQSFVWLTGRQEHLDCIYDTFVTSLKTKYYSTPVAHLYKAKKLVEKNLEFPEYILIIYFANQIIQIFLPFSDEMAKVCNAKRKLSLILFPAFIYDYHKSETPQKVYIDCCYYDLSIATSVTEDQLIQFSYKKREQIQKMTA